MSTATEWSIARSFVARRTALDVVLEEELRRVNSDDDQRVVSVALRPRAHLGSWRSHAGVAAGWGSP
jgi:hypothetical protein